VEMLCEIPKGSDDFEGIGTEFIYGISAYFFYGKNAEAFRLLGIAPKFILFF
jgi:hypothetical protein